MRLAHTPLMFFFKYFAISVFFAYSPPLLFPNYCLATNNLPQKPQLKLMPHAPQASAGISLHREDALQPVNPADESLIAPNQFKINDKVYKVTLAEALKMIGSQAATLSLAKGAYSISTNLTIPHNINLKLDKGTIFTIQNNVTLSLQCSLEAGPYQIFSCAGTGRVALGPGCANEIPLRWWGAAGDGVSNDTRPIQAAIDALAHSSFSATLVGSAGDLYLVDTLVWKLMGGSGEPNIRFCGNGASLKQAGLKNILNIHNSKGRLLIDQWNFIGSCNNIWTYAGLTSEPRNVTFDGTDGKKVNNITQVDSDYKWFYANGVLYTYSKCPLEERPNNLYRKSGIQADGGRPIAEWQRFFAGDAVFIGSPPERPGGVANIDIRYCNINCFDKIFHYSYGLCCSVKDSRILNCNYAIYGEDNRKGYASNGNVFDNVVIVGTYGDAAIYYKNAYGILFNHVVIDFAMKRIGHFINCRNINFDKCTTEAAGTGPEAADFEGMLFENVEAVNLINGKYAFSGKQFYKALFKFVKNTGSVRLEGNYFAIPCALYSTDGTVAGINIVGNKIDGLVMTPDARPAPVFWENNDIRQFGWIALPPVSLQCGIGKIYPEYALIYKKLSDGLPKQANVLQNHASLTIDHNTGCNDTSSAKIKWHGNNPYLGLNQIFNYPTAGNFFGVLTLFYKSDTSQKIRVTFYSAETARDVPVANDGQWRCLMFRTGSVTFPANPHGIRIDSSAASGNLWISGVSAKWFPTRAEACQWMGHIEGKSENFPWAP